VSEPFVLGVNYWPRRKAMGWWSDFDAAEVAGEFDLIADLGLGAVRIFLLWEDFQPTPDAVSAAALGHLVQVADIAQERGLRLDVTFFTGHMSGPNWAPGWLLDPMAQPPEREVVSRRRAVGGGYANPFTSSTARHAQDVQVRAVARVLRDHPALWLWNLGNEPDLFAVPPDAATGRAWAAGLARAIREEDASHPVTCGLHVASLVDDNGLRVDEVFEACDLSVMHAYPIYADWSAGPLDPDFVPFTCALTAALSGRPVLAEEFGACTAPPGEPTQRLRWAIDGRSHDQVLLAEDDLAAYLEQVLPRLVSVGARGALLWCFADYAPELWDRPPCDHYRHERYFGLVRPDGSLKPHAEVVRAFAASKPSIAEPEARARLAIDPDEFYRDPMSHLRRLYAAFRSG